MSLRTGLARLFAALTLSCVGAALFAAPVGGQPTQDLGTATAGAPLLPDLAAKPGSIALPVSPHGVLRGMGDAASELVISALSLLGVPYRRGGSSDTAGFDCSGFTRHVFENTVGLLLPRRSDEQAFAPELDKVRREDLQPGDLVFFNTLRRTFSHVGIYIGENRFVHSPRAGGAVRIEDMREGYWARRFTGARRADWPAQGGPEASRR